MKQIVAVSGKNGQLGSELKRLSIAFPQYEFIFCGRDELDVSNSQQAEDFFRANHPDFFINAAAYTAVDKAETDQQNAYKANAEAVGLLATLCKQYDTTFITFSTDYVFDGKASKPYKEEQTTAPINYYGYTKALGEKLALTNWGKTIVIRTSWVYSSFGNNFVKSMIRLMQEKPELNIVNDQVGSPTHAKDLAAAVLEIISKDLKNKYGIYHFSNEGTISWFDFAEEIKKLADLNCDLHPIPTSKYPTPAKRPAYSVLDKTKIISTLNIQLRDWKQSLQECMKELLK